MRWVAKALVQRTLSVLPRGTQLNYLLQRHVTRNLPVSDGVFRMHVEEAAGHYRALVRHRPGRAVGRAVLYEFGAGWDLVGPLTLAALGIRRQILVDLRANLRLDLADDTRRRLRAQGPELEKLLGLRLSDLGADPVTGLTELRERFGIEYHAPRDARATDLPAGSVDLVSSTFTLEHIPSADILAILRESRRLLRGDGLLSCAIDMKDHYSYFDPGLRPHHFLPISTPLWRVVNPALHWQNRLRLSDYDRLFAGAGFAAVEREVTGPTEEDRHHLRSMRLAPPFRTTYDLDDLGARELRLVATRGY